MSGMNDAEAESLYTIGHSSHTWDEFIDLLRRHEIAAVADVRSSPYSRHCPQFNREGLAAGLGAAHIEYIFMGDVLGARSDDPACCVDGRVSFPKMAETPRFRQGVDRLRLKMNERRTAILCSEKDPLDCHRAILICRHLRQFPVRIRHILEDGGLEGHGQAESRLVRQLKIEPSLFDADAGGEGLIRRAYDAQAERIAYRPESDAAAARNP
jgi:uncharacterized protein (DUF488 family)